MNVKEIKNVKEDTFSFSRCTGDFQNVGLRSSFISLSLYTVTPWVNKEIPGKFTMVWRHPSDPMWVTNNGIIVSEQRHGDKNLTILNRELLEWGFKTNLLSEETFTKLTFVDENKLKWIGFDKRNYGTYVTLLSLPEAPKDTLEVLSHFGFK